MARIIMAHIITAHIIMDRIIMARTTMARKNQVINHRLVSTLIKGDHTSSSSHSNSMELNSASRLLTIVIG